MDFLKNHYEKVILGVVLLGVVIFAALLPGKIAATQADLEAKLKVPEAGPPKPARPVDLRQFESALRVNASPVPLVLSGEHNTLNPVRWRRIIPGQPPEPALGDNIEVKQYFNITAIRPLTNAVWFDSVSGTGTSMRYQFMTLNEASAQPAGRRATRRSVNPAVGQKIQGVLTITEIRGPVGDPNEIVVEMADDKQIVVLGRGGRAQGFAKVVGHEADAFFQPTSKVFKGLRIGYPVLLGTEYWKVIAIVESSVTIENRIQKRETKQLASAPNP